MSLSPRVIGFLRAYDALADSCAQYPWGTVTRSPRLPHLRDANRTWVYSPPTPTLAQLQAAAATAQRVCAVPFTYVEVIDTDAHTALLSELEGWLGPPRDRFVFMEIEGAPTPARPLANVTLKDQPFPDRRRWVELLVAGHAGEDAPPPGVLEELALRDAGPLAAAGARLFTAERHGQVAAYASLLSLNRVGLVDHVATLPVHRRQGLAGCLVGAVIAASAAAGNRTTCLVTRAAGDALRVYRRLGMDVVARIGQYRADHPLGPTISA